MAKWIPGRSGNPNGRGRSKRLSAEWTVTRLERMLRVLYIMAEDGDLAAVRLAAENAEGKLVRQAAETRDKDEGLRLTAGQMAELLALALGKVEEWRVETRQLPPPEQNG